LGRNANSFGEDNFTICLLALQICKAALFSEIFLICRLYFFETEPHYISQADLKHDLLGFTSWVQFLQSCITIPRYQNSFFRNDKVFWVPCSKLELQELSSVKSLKRRTLWILNFVLQLYLFNCQLNFWLFFFLWWWKLNTGPYTCWSTSLLLSLILYNIFIICSIVISMESQKSCELYSIQ
jgi:hypothetical protein